MRTWNPRADGHVEVMWAATPISDTDRGPDPGADFLHRPGACVCEQVKSPPERTGEWRAAGQRRLRSQGAAGATLTPCSRPGR